MPRKRRPPRFYFSFHSPYSWLAYRDLMDHHPDVADRIEWRPFWEPDPAGEHALKEVGGSFPYVAMSRDKHLYILQDVRRLARERGLDVTWPVDRHPVWEVPHLAYLAAAHAGKGPEFIARVYRARWTEGENICDPATIARLAGELGLPAETLGAAAEDDGLREEGTAALLAVHDDGVFGVPFFVHGFDKYWGVDRLPAFIAALADAAPGDGAPDARPPTGGTLAQGGDQGHAGGCG